MSAPEFPQPPAGSAAPGLREQGYEAQSRLGEGASGEVWRAVHTASGREVAVKILKVPAGGADGGAAGRWEWRFQREVAAAAMLDHPNVCRLLDSGFLPGSGQAWMAMELVDGPPLTVHAAEENLTEAGRVALFRQVCAGVAHAHRRGILHRDLKPANIPVHHDGAPKVLDFGLARFLNDETAAGPAVSRDGALLGTPAYMAPEQIDGPAEPDTRSDIYSLGVVLYELLTGAPPHGESQGTAALLAAVGRGEPRPPRGVHADLSAIVMKALRKDPAGRYHSADSLGEDLDRFLRREPVRARQGQRWYAARLYLRRHWKAAAGWAVLGAGFAGVAGYAAWQRGEDLERRARMLSEARQAMEEMLVDLGTEATAAGHPELAKRMADHLAAIPWDWAGEHGGGLDARRHATVSARLRADMEASELRYPKALPLYQQAYQAADGLLTDHPGTPRFLMDAGLARLGAGLSCLEMGKHTEAADYLRRAASLLEKTPRSLGGYDLARTLRALGRLGLLTNRQEEAARAHAAGLAALAENTDAASLAEAALIRLENAPVLAPADSLAAADAALAALRALSAAPAASSPDHLRLAEGLTAHAAVMQARGEWRRALDSLLEALSDYNRLHAAEVAFQRFKIAMNLGRMLRRTAAGVLAAGDAGECMRILDICQEHLSGYTYRNSVRYAEVLTEQARATKLLAEARELLGHAKAARLAFQKAAKTLAEAAGVHHDRPGLHVESAEALLHAWRLRAAVARSATARDNTPLSRKDADALLAQAEDQLNRAAASDMPVPAEKDRMAALRQKLADARTGF